MAAAPRLKLADKQEVYKKLLAGLKKRYAALPKPPELPVLETMLFAVCLENASVKDADAAYKRMLAAFHDLNEIRVSSIDELETVFQGMSDTDWRASRIRGILSYVFESNYSFEYEGLRRKTLELATKQLSKIKELTPFIRDYTLHSALGAHLIPLDAGQLAVLEFLDLQSEAGGVEHTAESMRPLVRKAEGSEFCSLLREFSLDPKFRPQFGIVKQTPVNEGAKLPPALVRLDRLLKGDTIKWEGGQPRKSASEKRLVDKKAATAASSNKTAAIVVKNLKPTAATPSKSAAGKGAASKVAPKKLVKSTAQKPAAPPAKTQAPKTKPVAPAVASTAKKPVLKKPAPQPKKPTPQLKKASKPAPTQKSASKSGKKHQAKSGK